MKITFGTICWALCSALIFLLCLFGAFATGMLPHSVYVAVADKRYPDYFKVDIIVMYNTSVKKDIDGCHKLYTHNGSTMCGLPNAMLVFHNRLGKEVHREVADIQGRAFISGGTKVNDPLAWATTVTIESHNCIAKNYPIQMHSRIMTLGESLSAVQYHYEATEYITCVVTKDDTIP